MKRLIIGTLSAVALFTLAVPALGNDLVRVNSLSTRNIVKISPFNLVTGGYQGLFKDQGIPSSSVFVTSVRANEVDFLLDGLDKN